MIHASDRHGSVLRWEGLLSDQTLKTRAALFLLLIIVSAGMIFLQLGFICLDIDAGHSSYVLGLLAPITACALLLGKEWATLEGLATGAILYAHSIFQPLDVIEKYFVTPLCSTMLFSSLGFLLGLLFAIALRSNPTGVRRWVRITIICFVTAVFTSAAFEANAVLRMAELSSSESLKAVVQTGSDLAQFVFDFALMLITSILSDIASRWYARTRVYVSMRVIFRARMLMALFIVFVAVSAIEFAAITMQEERAANEAISGELDFLKEQTRLRGETIDEVLSSIDKNLLTKSTIEIIAGGLAPDELVSAYDLSDGTIVILNGDEILLSDNSYYPPEASFAAIAGQETAKSVPEIAESKKMQLMIYQDDLVAPQLGYMKAVATDADLHIVMARSFSVVFAHRFDTMLWTSFLTFVLLVVVYVLVDRLLRKVVSEPMDRTNMSLVRIKQGHLDEVVRETGTVEFTAFSAGINSTVDTLKRLISEAERRNERDMATAHAIQVGALPKAFPAFPDATGVDLYASMNAAKEVGGDFYDFFEIDDHTLAFLIADVSGKGIPGSLFMMAAKAQIQNYLSTGMEPAKAIAAANAHLCANNEAGMFVTVWAATLDWKTGALTYVNAGHNFPLLRHGHAGDWEWIKKKCGLFLGTFENAKYRQETMRLEPGDELILYTDGVNEAFSVDETEYGNARLEAFLVSHNDLRPQELVHALRADVAAWAKGAEQSDDITILAMEYRA